ncbi:MAG: DsbA family protein, partial [Thermodesulfobacteriota bacterium]
LGDYKGKVKLVYKQLPLLSHPWAKDAAIASVCAYQQGNDNFWEFHDLVFENQKQITVQNSNDRFKEFAKNIGLDTNKFNQCLSSPEITTRVQNEIQEAQSVGATATPTFIVNGITVRGADPEGLKSAIETSLSGDS